MEPRAGIVPKQGTPDLFEPATSCYIGSEVHDLLLTKQTL